MSDRMVHLIVGALAGEAAQRVIVSRVVAMSANTSTPQSIKTLADFSGRYGWIFPVAGAVFFYALYRK